MCVALIKNKGVELPNENILKVCFKNNPDGAGFVYCRNGRNYIRKGFFTFEGFYKALQDSNIKKDECALIHFRVATHGKINIENCHPFPITDNFSDMTYPEVETTSSVMVHNGKLTIPITNSIYSDSMHFARSLFGFDRFENKAFINFIIQQTEKNKRGNRIGIINTNSTIEKYGVGWVQEDGIFYSNDSYKEDSTYKQGLKKKNKTKKYTNQIYTTYKNCNICEKMTPHVSLTKKAYNSEGLITFYRCEKCLKNEGFIQCNKCNNYFKPTKNNKDCVCCSNAKNNPFGQIGIQNGKLLLL